MKKAILAFLILLALMHGCLSDEFYPTQIESVEADVFIKGTGSVEGKLSRTGFIELTFLTYKETDRQEVLEREEYVLYGGKKFPPIIEKDEFGNRLAVFRLEGETYSGFEYFLKAKVKTLPFGKISDFNLENGIDEFDSFKKKTHYINPDSATAQTIAANYFQDDSELETIRDIVAFVNDRIKYAREDYYISQTFSSDKTLKDKKGVCDELTNVTMAFLRARGIPAKFIVGIMHNSKNWESHAWPSAYIPGTGWIELDPTNNNAGRIDGTHIVLAEYADRYDQPTITGRFTQGVNITLDAKDGTDYSVEEDVTVISKDYFSAFVSVNEFDLNKTTYPNTPALIELKITNKSDSYQFVPLQAFFHEDFRVYGTQKNLLLLEPFETEKIDLNVIPLKSLEEGMQVNYTYNIVLPLKVIVGSIKVLPADQELEENNFLALNSITPIISGDVLEIEIKIDNYAEKDEELAVIFNDGLDEKEIIEGRTSKSFIYKIPLNRMEELKIELFGKGLSKVETIYIHEEKIRIEEQDLSDVPEKKISAKVPPVTEDTIPIYLIILGVTLISFLMVYKIYRHLRQRN